MYLRRSIDKINSAKIDVCDVLKVLNPFKDTEI